MEDTAVAGVQLITHDFSKAFDRIQFGIILQRLIECKFSIQTVSWVKSYLENRFQFVKVGESMSELKSICSGVPQGSILGPYLFALVTGSFKLDNEDCKLVMYADDFSICAPIKRLTNNVHISEAHQHLLRWSTDNSLQMNLKKCHSIVIPKSQDCVPIPLSDVMIVKELKLLGVVFNSKGNWTRHVEKKISQASRNLYIIRVLKYSLSKEQLIMVYNSTIRSILEYASPLFVGLSKKNALKLESVQKRFHRILCGPHCSEHKLVSLEVRRKVAATKLFKKATSPEHIIRVHDLLPIQSSSGRFILPQIKQTRRLHSFIIFTALLINSYHQR